VSYRMAPISMTLSELECSVVWCALSLDEGWHLSANHRPTTRPQLLHPADLTYSASLHAVPVILQFAFHRGSGNYKADIGWH